jgi:sugar phosphate isomerase/epimerase
MNMDQLVSSPACLPKVPLEELLPLYAGMGFGKFEAFSHWCASRLDFNADPQPYLDMAARHHMRYTSFHLPPVTTDFDASVEQAIVAARFAQRIGASVVLFKADSRENYIRGARPFLDRIEREQIRVTPVLQNHRGTPITTLDDFRAVIEGIADPRMKALLEVGHFARVGTHWRQGYELLAGRIALVHINDIQGDASVPYGTGIVDFRGLFDQLRADGYAGDIVVELELHTLPQERIVQHLNEAVEYLRPLIEG